MQKHTRRQSTMLVALFMSLAIVAAACGDDDTSASDTTTTTAAPTETTATQDTSSGNDADAALQDLVAKAQEDGSCTIYSSQALDNLNSLADAFEKEYPGISVDVVRGTDGDNIPRLETELSTNTAGADLAIVASKGWVVDHAKAGDYVDPTAAPQLAGMGDFDTSAFFHDGNYFEVGAAVLSMGWNTEHVPDGLKDMTDLLDPSLSGGKIGVIDPAIAPAVVDYWLWIEENWGEDFVKQLAAQKPRIYPSTLPIGEALQSGEVYATGYAAPTQLIPAAASGAPVDYSITDKGAWGARFYGFIPKSADDPSCAALLANFILTPDGQHLINGASGTVLEGVPDSLIYVGKVRDMDLAGTAPDAAAAYVAKWNALFR